MKNVAHIWINVKQFLSSFMFSRSKITQKMSPKGLIRNPCVTGIDSWISGEESYELSFRQKRTSCCSYYMDYQNWILAENHDPQLLQHLFKLIFFLSLAAAPYHTLPDSFPDEEVSFLSVISIMVVFHNTLLFCCSFTTFYNFFGWLLLFLPSVTDCKPTKMILNQDML